VLGCNGEGRAQSCSQALPPHARPVTQVMHSPPAIRFVLPTRRVTGARRNSRPAPRTTVDAAVDTSAAALLKHPCGCFPPIEHRTGRREPKEQRAGRRRRADVALVESHRIGSRRFGRRDASGRSRSKSVQVGSGRVGSGRVESGRVGSGSVSESVFKNRMNHIKTA